MTLTVREVLVDRYPPEYLDLDRLNANLAVIDEELTGFRNALPHLRSAEGKTVEATKCSVLIGEHQVKKDELMELVSIKKEWIRENG